MNYDKGDAKTNIEIQKFFRELSILGFLQSGLNYSKISFTQIIPDAIYAQRMTDPLKQVKDQLDRNPDVILPNFYHGFIHNNPTIYKVDGNKEPYRFKDYVNYPLKKYKFEFPKEEDDLTTPTEADPTLPSNPNNDQPESTMLTTDQINEQIEKNRIERGEISDRITRNDRQNIDEAKASSDLADIREQLLQKYPDKQTHIERLVTLQDYKNALSLYAVDSVSQYSKFIEEVLKTCV